MSVTTTTALPCDACELDPCRCEDPDFQREEQADAYFDEHLRPLLRRASDSDRSAELAGLDAVALLALRDALERAVAQADELHGHEHEWNANDYCNVCGADGRA